MNRMMATNFECLPDDVVFEIFGYLSPDNILQSFFSLNKHFSKILMYQYLWRIHLDGTKMSLTIFKDFCQNVIKLIGHRVLSLRINLNSIIGGWSLVSSSLKYRQTTLLRHLHLIDIKPHEFDKLLCNLLVKQLHTLVVDVKDCSAFRRQVVEGAYLAKVCSKLPNLRSCRLPFDFCPTTRSHLPELSAPPLMTLPTRSNTIYLHTLTTGINSIHFLECLVKCIPSIQNLSVGVQDAIIFDKDEFDLIPLPATVDACLLPRLSRLCMNCVDRRSFHRAVALLSSVFVQLTHLSLELYACTSMSDHLFISGDTIQQLCIDRLKASAIYTLNLSFCVMNDSEKRILNSFLKAPFTGRARPKVFIQKRDRNRVVDAQDYYFLLYTLPNKRTELPMYLFSRDLEESSFKMSMKAVDLFSHANELVISDFQDNACLSDLVNCKSSLSSLVPWSLLTKISICYCDVITASELERLLPMVYNLHTLRLVQSRRISWSALFRIYDNLGSRASEQIQSLGVHDGWLTLHGSNTFHMLLCDRFPNLKVLLFTTYNTLDFTTANPSYMINCKNECTKYIVNLIHFLVDHLQHLVSLQISFSCWSDMETACFPHVIRRRLHEWPLSRSYRLRCSVEEIQIWL